MTGSEQQSLEETRDDAGPARRASPEDVQRLERLLRRAGRAGLGIMDSFLAERGVDGAVELPAPDFERLCVRLEEEARLREGAGRGNS